MDLSSLIKDLNITIKRGLANFGVVYAFWTVPFYLFKPEILEKPIYVGFFLVFCFTFIWMCLNLVLLGVLTLAFAFEQKDNHKFTMELLSLLSIFTVCIFILISYYFSDTFTLFLRKSFISIFLAFALPLTFGSLMAKFSRKK